MIERLLSESFKSRYLLTRPFISVRRLASQKGSTPFSPSNRPIKTFCAEKPAIKFNLLNDKHINGFGPKFVANSLAGSNVELSDLEFNLAGRSVAFNLTWLRDSCHCSQCTHKHSRQRLFTPKEFHKHKFGVDDIKIVDNVSEASNGSHGSQEYDKDGSLFIRWTDGHESQYSLKWLCDISDMYRQTNVDLRTNQTRPIFNLPRDDFYSPPKDVEFRREYWTVEQINKNLKAVDYNDLIDGFEFHDHDPTFINANDIREMSERRYNALVNLTSQLTTFGLAKIINVPAERNQVLRVARSMAYERPTGYGTIFDVVIEPSEEINLAYSSQEFDLHSDLTYRESSPGVQLLHCIRNSEDGGWSYFSDAFKAAHMLEETDPILFEVLLRFPAIFVVRDPYRNVKFRRQKTILTLNHQNELDEVYYSPFMLPPIGHKDDVKLLYLALDKFTQLLQSKENKLITMMNPGDLFIFQNRRVLHGRSSYKATNNNRFLQGCYMDWDEICCLYEKLIANKPGPS
jgi:gamma-butyrobetaine dioxygenase